MLFPLKEYSRFLRNFKFKKTNLLPHYKNYFVVGESLVKSLLNTYIQTYC